MQAPVATSPLSCRGPFPLPFLEFFEVVASCSFFLKTSSAPLSFVVFFFRKVLDAGADSIAVISAITKADDVGEAVRKWSALFKAKGSEGGS